MSALLDTWNGLGLRKQAMLGLAVAATLAVMAFIAQGVLTPRMALLFGGLDPKAAGEVQAALEQLGVPTDVRGDSIYVPAHERDRVRLALAKDGLPSPSQAGYELLDQLSGLATSEMFDATYWRAKEGELARTIEAMPNVVEARVHIGRMARRPFRRRNDAPTAAVTVHTRGAFGESAALSVRYLVALAVAGLEPKQVAVIDGRTNTLILRPGEERAGADHAMDDSRAMKIKRKLEELLSVRVGEGSVRISVTVETSRKSQKISERIIDPESGVPINSASDTSSTSSTTAANAVTVASNLPDGEAAGGAGKGESKTETAKETVEFTYSETRRDEVVAAGAVKKIGVAVLVDEVAAADPDGVAQYTPRTPEELAAIEELVKSAIAYDAERGDVVTVESMRFAAMPEQGVVVQTSMVERAVAEHLMTLVQVGVLAVVALVLGLFVIRPILASRPAEGDALTAQNEALGLPAAPTGEGGLVAIGPDGAPAYEASGALARDGETPVAAIEGESSGAAPAQIAGAAAGGESAAAALEAPSQSGGALTTEDEGGVVAASVGAMTLLRDVVDEKAEESAAVLKRWLHGAAEAPALPPMEAVEP